MAIPLTYATPTRTYEPRWLSVVCLMVAAVATGVAINVRDGEYAPRALALISVALPLCVAGTLVPRVRDAAGYGPTIGGVVLGGLLVLQFFVTLASPPSGWNSWSDDLGGPAARYRVAYHAGVSVALLSTRVMLVQRLQPLRPWRYVVPLVLTIHFLTGVWMIRATPSPHIDVHVFQQEGPRALLEGRNPYATQFTDIYRSTDPGQRPVYGPELSRDGTLAFGFPYPPLSLYCATAGYGIAGDHRYAQLVAVTAAGALMAYARPELSSALMAVMFLFTPRGFFVLGRGWTEPFVVLFLAATVFCACRCRRLLPVALGLFLASKQYLVLTLPLVPLLIEGPFRRREFVSLLAKAAAVALLVSLPMALWNPGAFHHSLVTVQQVAPFREDALSYLVWFVHQTGLKPGIWPAFAAAGVAVALALWRAERSPAGFAAAVAMVFLPFIALNKQAFANYYYFVIGALWCALAVMPATPRPDPAATTVAI